MFGCVGGQESLWETEMLVPQPSLGTTFHSSTERLGGSNRTVFWETPGLAAAESR